MAIAKIQASILGRTYYKYTEKNNSPIVCVHVGQIMLKVSVDSLNEGALIQRN